MQSPAQDRTRPQGVTIAIILLYVAMALWIAGSLYFLKSYPVDKKLWFWLGADLVNFALLFSLICLLGLGKRWARITFLMVFIVFGPLSFPDFSQSLTADLIRGVYYIADFGLIIAALILLFQKEATNWFDRLGVENLDSESDLIVPKRIQAAITFLYIRLGIYLYSEVITIVSFLLGLSELKLGYKLTSHIGIYLTTHVWSLLTITAVKYAIPFLLLYMTAKRRNWARIMILISCILGFPGFVSSLKETAITAPYFVIPNLALLALEIVALVYLFQKEANEWFKKAGQPAPAPCEPADIA